MTAKEINTWQGVAAFVGITVGAIPLVRCAVQGRPGSLWEWAIGAGPSGWAGPLAVVVVTVLLVALLERRKTRAS